MDKNIFKTLLPKGILRAGINMSNFLLVTGKKADGSPDGVSPDLVKQIALDLKVNYELIPKAVFSQPEIATVGFDEDKAIKCFGKDKIKVYTSTFRPMSQSLSKIGANCLLKLIVDTDSEKIVGCHMVGEHAAEIIQMASISLGMGATKSDFDQTMALHPTIAEEFVTMS